jgi:hypothetical protein
MKEFLLRVDTTFDAVDAADACRKVARHFDQLSRLFDGTLSEETEENELQMKTGEVHLRPLTRESMNG